MERWWREARYWRGHSTPGAYLLVILETAGKQEREESLALYVTFIWEVLLHVSSVSHVLFIFSL